MEDVQRLQNQTMRLVTGTRLLDKKLFVELLKETGYYSVNQMTAQVLLQEAWKMNKDTKPLLDNEPEIAKRTSDIETRSITRGDMTVDKFRTQIGQYNFTNVFKNLEFRPL